MKKLIYFIVFIVALGFTKTLNAQVGVSIRILPPYPNRITDYESRPQQVLITLTNQSAGTQQIQLRASVVGDNGIRLEVGRNYKSSSAITLAPGQVRNLNGADLVTLFDYNQLTYTGITKEEFIRGNGLPEGSYQVCMQAFDYNTNAPISPDEPVGCSNRFSISSLEPPLIIKPFDGDDLKPSAGNIFTINWTTPPGAPPSIRYKIRMIEVLANRNPNDAYLSAVPPYFFEKEVMGNLYVYNPSDPQFTVGRRYVLAVTAFDPNNSYTFRNNGISQVSSFTYGSQVIAAGNETKPTETKQEPKKPMTTNSIRGKALWAFKASEESYKGATAVGGSGSSAQLGTLGNITNNVVEMPRAFATAGLPQTNFATQAKAPTTNTAVKTNTNVIGGVVFNSFNPLTDNPTNVKKALSTDKTLLATTASNNYVSGLVAQNIADDKASLSSSIFVTGNQGLDFSIDAISATASNNKMPLANATVKIIGVVSSTPAVLGVFNTTVKKEQEKQKEQEASQFGIFTLNKNGTPAPQKGVVQPTVNSKNQPATTNKNTGNTFNIQPLEPNLIASGRTDAEGNFDVSFADLNYTGGNRFSSIKIVITKGAIEETKTIPISTLQNPDVDLGEILCIASTYRFTPKVELPQIQGTANDSKNIVVKIYREEADAIAYPFLAYDGNLSPDRKTKEIIGGKNMVLIAADSVGAKSAGQFKFAKLFEGINYTVQISTGGNVNKRSGGLRLAKTDLSNAQVANVKPSYTLTALPPSIIGSVQLSLKSGFASVKDAIVRVEFNKEDVEEQSGLLAGSLVTSNNQYSAQLVNGVNNTNANLQRATPVLQSVSTAKSSTASNFYTGGATTSIFKGGPTMTTVGNALAKAPTAVNMIDPFSGPYTSKTDSAGNYAIGNLPRLKEGKTFTVKLLKVPAEFQNLQIEPSNSAVVNRVLDGEQKDVSFRIKPDLVQIAGRVVAEDKKALNNARLNFEGSTDMFTTGETGLFTTTYFPGTHNLIIKKEGYVDAKIKVIVPSKSGGSNNGGTTGNQVAQLPSNVLQNNHLFQAANVFDDTRAKNLQNTQANSMDLSIQLLNTPTIKNEIAKGASFSPMMFGVAGSQSATKVNSSGIKSLTSASLPAATNVTGTTGKLVSFSSNSFSTSAKITDVAAATSMSQALNNALTNSNYGSNTLTTLDLGDVGFLKRRVGKIRFKVLDAETNSVIAEAKIKLFDTVGVTDNKGEWYYEGFGGEAKVAVTAPNGTAYVMTEESLLVNETGSEIAKAIKLQKGIKVSGFVRKANNTIDGVTIKVEEKPYLITTTDASGAYNLYIPKGKFQLKASKSGYISKVQSVNATSTPIQLDFELADGGGRNIAKILGFDVELDQMTPEGNGYRVSGAFVNLKPALTELKSAADTRLQFSNIKINFDASNSAIPEGNRIVTDELSLPFKLLNFIPVALKSPNGITVETDGNGGGKITAEIVANMAAIQGGRGWGLSNADIKLLPDNVTATTFVTAFASSTTTQVNLKYKIKGPQGGWQGNLYGFKLMAQTEQSYIDNSGLHFVGELHTPDLGVIKSAVIKIEELLIGSDLMIKRVNLNQTGLPAIKILDWSANLASLLFNEDGFKIGGNMVIKVPASGTSEINFSDVTIGKDMFFGGKFVIPENGINIFNIVSLKKGASPISFGQVPNQSGVYKLGGSGKIKFTKFITSEINIPIFEVHTNGRFLVDAPVNFETNLMFAKLKVQAIKFDNTGGTPLIGVQGAVSVDVPLLKLTAADISFKNSGGGVSVSVGKIKASLDVPVLKTEIEVDMKDNGFAGSGKLGIPGTPVNAGIDFHYYKVTGGVDFGAKFSANVTIPIGFVTIERVGGGFQYNTATKDFMVDINGALSIANLGAAVKLDPIGLTVRSGPVIEGYGGVVVGSTLNLANARMKLDFPQETFSVTVDSHIEPIKGIVKTKLQGDLIISLKKDDRFAFLGCAMETNLLGLIKSNGEFALGVGVKNPVTRGDRVSYYFRNVDRKYVQDVFSGVYINTTAQMGIPKERAIGFDFKFASASLYFYTESNAKLILNFAEDSYLLGLSGRFGGGFEFCAVGLCLGADYKACYEFMGGRNDADGWFIGGKAAGAVSLKVGGCNPGCNDWSVRPFCAGFKLCGEGGVEINYAQRRGLGFSVFVGGNPLCR